MRHEITHPEHRTPGMRKTIYVDVKPVGVKDAPVVLNRAGSVSPRPVVKQRAQSFARNPDRKMVDGKPKIGKQKPVPTPATQTRTAGKSGISAEIIALCESGKTQNEIIAAGYLRNTVVPVVWKWKKSKQLLQNK